MTIQEAIASSKKFKRPYMRHFILNGHREEGTKKFHIVPISERKASFDYEDLLAIDWELEEHIENRVIRLIKEVLGK